MTVEKFLIFWDQNNIIIIEGLVALIIATALFVAYRGFFSKKGDDSEHSMGGGIDAAQLEKTLQKILENQRSGGGANGAGEDMGMHVDIPADSQRSSGGAGATAGENTAEVQNLKKTLAERQQQIDALQTKVKEAAAAAEAAAASGGGGAGGLSLSDQNALNDKIRDLEARLSEYEIISEDIADLSKYRDENDKLKVELEALKASGGGGAAAPAAAAPVAPATPAAPPAAPPPAAAAPEVEAAPEPASESAPEATPEPAAEPSSVIDDDLMAEFAAAVGDQKANAPEPKTRPTPTVTDAEAAEALADSASTETVIDDDLMKEFEAAVAGQKLDSAAEKAGKGDAASEKTGDDTEKLMDEFQSFVTKKS